jgi:membrane-associated phospholipid phosphatase
MRIIEILVNPSMMAIAALFLSVIWMLRDQNDKTRIQLVFAFVLNLFYNVLLHTLMGREGSLFPWKYDDILLHLDVALGIRAASVASDVPGFMRFPLWIVYQMIVPMMIVWFLVTKNTRAPGSIIHAYVAELVAGPLIYTIVPACGPVYAFGNQWLSPPAVSAVPIRLTGMPNAFPSLHVGTAFIFVLFASGKLWRTVALLFLIGTCLSTLSTGAHYVIDLIPGFAFGIFAASVGLGQKKRAAFFLALVVFWSLLVRFGNAFLIANPSITRSLSVLTLALAAVVLWYQWRAAIPSRELLAEVV